MSTSTLASRLGAFRALADNKPLRRVVGDRRSSSSPEYSVWIAMLIYAYSRGGAAIAGVVAPAQPVPAALLAPVFAAVVEVTSPARDRAHRQQHRSVRPGRTGVRPVRAVPPAHRRPDRPR